MGNPSKWHIIGSHKDTWLKVKEGVKKMTRGNAQKMITAQNIIFESTMESECRIWKKTEDDHPLKKALCKAEVDKIIFLPYST